MHRGGAYRYENPIHSRFPRVDGEAHYAANGGRGKVPVEGSRYRLF